MYSDNHFEDLAFDQGSANPGYSSTFDINDFGLSSELFSDPSYHISASSSSSSTSNPLLQTIQRNTASSSSGYSNNNNNNAFQHEYSKGITGGVGVGNSITGGLININNNENDNPSSSSGIGNALLGSPQPSTIKKLKSHLSGIGGIGGYLTSPMGAFRQHTGNNDSSNASPAYSVLKPKASSSGSSLNQHHQHSLGSSPLKPIHSSSQQKQDPQCLELNSATITAAATTTTLLPPMPQPLQGGHSGSTLQYEDESNNNNNAYSATRMQRLQSAPAAPVSNISASTSSSMTNGRSSRNSKRNNNNNVTANSSNALNIPPLQQQAQSATATTFNEMDYGGMRIYGRPIKQRSNSEDPSSSSNTAYDNDGASTNEYFNSDGTRKLKANASFLPYPDQLPTVTLGRGIKNARDVLPASSQMQKSESEPIPNTITTTTTTTTTKSKGFTNLNKPFIQYVPPNSPAAKSSNVRNKKSLTVKTDSSSNNDSQNISNSNNNKGKMVPIKMTRQAHEISPLTPPISANIIPGSSNSMTSPHQHQLSQMQSYQQNQSIQSSSQQQQQQQQQQSYMNQQQTQLSPYHQQQQDAYLSPSGHAFDFSNDPQNHFGIIGGGQSNLPSIMPSFEFSLEQFGADNGNGGQCTSNNPTTSQDLLSQFGNNHNDNNNNGYSNAIDFSSVLGLPSPHQHQGPSNIVSQHGLLSPTSTTMQPPHSATSTHSSVFSDDQALLFGIPPPASPYFTSNSATSPSSNANMILHNDESQSQSIDQALASLLGGTSQQQQQQQQMPNRDGSSTPQPQLSIQNFSPSSHHSQYQQQQMFSPHMPQRQQHQGQVALGISSPPLSPQHNNVMTSPAPSTSWAPYQQQQNLLPNIDPSLQGLDNNTQQQQQQQNFAMLSPQSAQYGSNNNIYSNIHHNNTGNYVQGNNGRILSSPRRLRGMQSAPDLNALYSDNSPNGFNQAFGIISPSPRKPSLKRGRGSSSIYGDGDSDEENQQTPSQHHYAGYTQYGDGSSEQDDEDDEYTPGDRYDRPPPRKRANSIHSDGKLDPSFHNGGSNNAVAAVLLPLVNPNPARLRPGPKPKTSLPNLQAAHQGVFQVSPRAPPVPAFPAQFLAAVTSPNPSHHTAESSSGQTPVANAVATAGGVGAGCLSPDPDTGYLKPQPGGVSKDMLATFYQIGTGSKQTKKGKPQRMYICSIPGCEKEFPRKSAVESHIQTHLEDKPFACPYDNCGASFVRSHDLTRHVRIHSGSKPFQCICGKGFARGDALTRHRQRGICEGSLVPRRW